MSNFSELRQFGIMKVGCIIPVIGILAFRNKKSWKIQNHKFISFAPRTNFLFYSIYSLRQSSSQRLSVW